MEDYSIRPMGLVGCDMPVNHVCSQYGFGETFTAIAYSWYIEGPDKKILVDTSTRANLLRFPGKKDYITPEERLKDFGLKCSDIDIVIMTHLHYDHFGYATKYPNATFYIQKKEWEFANDVHPGYILWFSYDRRMWEELDIKMELIEGDQEIVKGVKTMVTPGHTPGCQSVLVETGKGLAGITGFCCINQNFEAPVPLHNPDGIINLGLYYDGFLAYENILKIRNTCDIIIPAHDPEHAQKERIPEPDVVYRKPWHQIR